MTVRVAGSRFKCKAHAGEALALSCRSKCSNVLYIGTPLMGDGARDLQGSFPILSVGAHTHPPLPITTSTRGLLLTAADVREHHCVSLAAEEEDVRDKPADEYGRVAAAVPQTALRNARRQATAERNPWGQGRDAALQSVARAVTARDPYLRAPVVSAEMGYIFPVFFESNVRRVANGVLALETDEYYKAIESAGLARDGDNFVLAITTTIDNNGMTLARFFIQRATRQVARTCYKLFFHEVLKINPNWAPWHVLVARKLQVVDSSLDGPRAAAVVRQATELVQKMNQGVLVGVTLDVSASLAGGICDALEDVGFDEFDADGHARNILFGCKAHANRVCDPAPLTVRAPLRQLTECVNVDEAQRLRALVIQHEPTRDCVCVLANKRLLLAFCPAFSEADDLQREVASSTTKTEESQHEGVYKLCGWRQPLMVAMTGSKFVDQRDADELEDGRAAGEYTPMERADHSQRRRDKRRRARLSQGDFSFAQDVPAEVGQVSGAAASVGPGDGDGGGQGTCHSGRGALGASTGSTVGSVPAAGRTQPQRKRSRGVRAAPSSSTDVRIAELEKQLLEQRNKTLEAENAALRASANVVLGGSADGSATAKQPNGTQSGGQPPRWFINLMTAASQVPS